MNLHTSLPKRQERYHTQHLIQLQILLPEITQAKAELLNRSYHVSTGQQTLRLLSQRRKSNEVRETMVSGIHCYLSSVTITQSAMKKDSLCLFVFHSGFVCLRTPLSTTTV